MVLLVPVFNKNNRKRNSRMSKFTIQNLYPMAMLLEIFYNDLIVCAQRHKNNSNILKNNYNINLICYDLWAEFLVSAF